MNEPRTYRSQIKSTSRSQSQAKQLRRKLTPPECRLWLAIKTKKLNELHFRKQVAVGPYIADFYCHAARLVVEVDGSMHSGKQLIRDQSRDAWMREHGIKIVRFPASDVRDHLEGVLHMIRRVAEKQMAMREQARTQE